MRSGLPEGSLVGTVRRAVAAVDPQVPLEFRYLRALVAESVADRRFTMVVLVSFALIALLLAVVGIYAVVSYTVAQRTREMGVRLALGASPARLRWLVLRGSMVAVAPGLLVGALLAIASAGTMRSLVYGVSPFAMDGLLVAVVVLAAAALLSSLLPAIRATKIDPVTAIRTD